MFFNKDNKIKKILILRFGAIGDVVHSTALYRSLKKMNPSLEIHYVTFKFPALLIENDNDLKKIWIADNKTYKTFFILAKKLKQEKFDLFINLQPSIRTKIFGLFFNPKKTLIYKKTFKLHAVENFWNTAKPEFNNIILDNEIKLYLPDNKPNAILSLINSNKKIIAFNIGTSNARQGRKWPINYWKELAQIIINKYNCQIILNGSKEDAEISEKLLEISPNITSFCGRLNLLESTVLLSKCNLMISGDTGPLHIATAVGTPSIGLYGSAPISRTGPYGKTVFALSSERKCVPCNRRKCKFINKNEIYSPCMIDIKPDNIIDLINKNLLI